MQSHVPSTRTVKPIVTACYTVQILTGWQPSVTRSTAYLRRAQHLMNGMWRDLLMSPTKLWVIDLHGLSRLLNSPRPMAYNAHYTLGKYKVIGHLLFDNEWMDGYKWVHTDNNTYAHPPPHTRTHTHTHARAYSYTGK